MVKARVVVFLAKLHSLGRAIVRRNKIHAAEIGAQCFVTFSEIMADGATVSYCEGESVQYRKAICRAFFSLSQCKKVFKQNGLKT
jgi:hypothetical protein